MDTKDLLTLESKIYQEYENDGSIEFLMGVGLFFASAVLERSLTPAVGGIIPVFLILFKRAWKKYITYPRLGYAQFSASRMRLRKRQMLTILVVAVACVAFITLGMVAATGILSPEALNVFAPYMKIVFGGIIVAIILAVAAVRRLKHLYYVGALASVCYILGYVLGLRPGIALLITSGVLLIMAIVRVIRFMKANPKLEDGGVHDANA